MEAWNFHAHVICNSGVAKRPIQQLLPRAEALISNLMQCFLFRFIKFPFTGGIAHGVRGPRTWFYMLPGSVRIKGLCVALTIKHAQDDLVIVDSLDGLPTDDPAFLQEMAEERNWGYSVLFVDW